MDNQAVGCPWFSHASKVDSGVFADTPYHVSVLSSIKNACISHKQALDIGHGTGELGLHPLRFCIHARNIGCMHNSPSVHVRHDTINFRLGPRRCPTWDSLPEEFPNQEYCNGEYGRHGFHQHLQQNHQFQYTGSRMHMSWHLFCILVLYL